MTRGAATSHEVVPTGPLTGAVAAPASKSVTNRLLLLAALADGTSVLRTPLVSDDSAAMRNVVQGLGAAVWEVGRPGEEGHAWHVAGTGGRLAPVASILDCRLSGTTIRFGTAVAALVDGRITLTGDAPLRRRPLGPLVAALRDLGAVATDTGGFPPVTVGGGLDGGVVSIDVAGSSQFASAVLLAAPYARGDVHLTTTGASAGAYIDLTAAAMRDWGAEVWAHGVVASGDTSSGSLPSPSVGSVDSSAPAWTVTAGAGYRARDLVVEYDASAAAHLFGLAVATGGSVTVVNVTDTIQPDAGVLDVLVRFGATVRREGSHVTVIGPDRPTPVGTVDLSRMPDQVTTVAALAALADGITTIVGTEVVRGHETDRLMALATELAKIGTTIEERADGLVIDGRTTVGGASLDTYHDHRLAMAFAALGARVPGVVINDPGCVAKTFPDFWRVMVGLGGQVGTR